MSNGKGNYSISDPDDMDYWNRVFDSLNYKMQIFEEQSCMCTGLPSHYTNIHIEFDPRFVEIQNSYYWNHRNDADSNQLNSFNKPYLDSILYLASQTPGYIDGIAWIITMDSIFWNRWIDTDGAIPIWNLGYDCNTGPVYTRNGGCVNYSGFPSATDLSRPAIWHSPDKYLIDVNAYNHVYPYGQDIIDIYIGATAEGALHEYGHLFNLNDISDTSICSKNVMQQRGSSGRSSLSGCQVRTMYETLMTRSLRKYVICEDKLDFNLTIDSDETWRIKPRIFGDIVIKDSATLTITCEVAMDPNARIIIERGGKLIIDGGLITSDCEEKWNGIIIEGDVPGKQAHSGKVVLKNMATIEMAETAISMFPSHLPWDNGGQKEYYAGIVEAVNSTFRNCDRAVEFMQYDSMGHRDSSFFNNVLFENLNYGVTMWADDGVTFDSCTFNNISNAGIYAYDSEVIVRESNTFDSIPIGIDILATLPRLYSSKIGQVGVGSNLFNTDKGVNIQSSGNIEPLKIENNIISNGTRGISHNGNGLLDVHFNYFADNRIALEIYDSGKKSIDVWENIIENSNIGTVAVQQNTELKYFDNCFDGSIVLDIGIASGGIYPFQGSPDIAAGNCFTKSSIPEIYNVGGQLLTYFVKTGVSASSCKYPQNSAYVTLDFNAAEDNNFDCTIPIPFTSEDEYFCEIEESDSISQLMNQRDSVLTSLGGTLNTFQRRRLEGCLESLESIIGSKMLDPNSSDVNGGKENAIAFFTSVDMTFIDWTTAFGIMVQAGELSRADTFLNSLSTLSAEEDNFVTVQNINLDYLNNPSAYVLTQGKKDTLYSIGTTEGALNGYARSLYEVLTGERIEIEIPIDWRGSEEITSSWIPTKVSVFPNPLIDDYFQITIENLGDKNTCQLVPNGVYMVSVIDNLNNQLYQNKLIVIK